jgi:hypothetical protein
VGGKCFSEMTATKFDINNLPDLKIRVANSGEIVREFYYESTDVIINPLDPAIIKVNLGALTKYPGYYSTNDGFLDDDIYIQDSRYYQVYSYLIKIDERLESYKSAVKTLVHPAGLALFGEYDIRNEFHLDLDLQSLIQILVLTFQDEFFVRDDTLIEFIIGKLIEISFTTTEQTTFALNKPLATDFELSDAAVFRDFGKNLTSATTGFTETTVRNFGKSLSSVQTVVEDEIRFVSKALENNFDPTDNAVLRTDKYISISTSAVGSGGDIWLSPYNNPYPESDAYFANDAGNYTTGESAFTG